MIIGPLFLHLCPETSSLPSKKAMGPVGQVIAFGLMGFFVTWNWATAIPRLSAGRMLTSQISYVQVPGWKNCRFGAEFADAGGAGTIRVCGPLWHLPSEPERGTIRVTEKVGGLGVYLLRIEPI
ncbi:MULTISPECIES: hypothetical protein [Ralstonia]|nr:MULTISPECIES: hypothetical protein [Ralstonia]